MALQRVGRDEAPARVGILLWIAHADRRARPVAVHRCLHEHAVCAHGEAEHRHEIARREAAALPQRIVLDEEVLGARAIFRVKSALIFGLTTMIRGIAAAV